MRAPDVIANPVNRVRAVMRSFIGNGTTAERKSKESQKRPDAEDDGWSVGGGRE